jgi:broad specificity phosphatase PhoE
MRTSSAVAVTTSFEHVTWRATQFMAHVEMESTARVVVKVTHHLLCPSAICTG